MSYKVLHHLDSRCHWISERAFGLRKYPIWRVVEARGLNILVPDVLKGTPFHPLNSYPVLFLKRFTNSTSSGASTQVGLRHQPAPIWRQYSHRHRGGPLQQDGSLHASTQAPFCKGNSQIGPPPCLPASWSPSWCGGSVGRGAMASLSSGFQPQSNSQTEQKNQEMETALHCIVSGNPLSWSQHLLRFEYAHNTHCQWPILIPVCSWVPTLFLSGPGERVFLPVTPDLHPWLSPHLGQGMGVPPPWGSTLCHLCQAPSFPGTHLPGWTEDVAFHL